MTILLDGFSDFIEALARQITTETAIFLVIMAIIAIALLARIDR